VLSAGLEASKLWIRESINLQRELVEELRRRARPLVTMEYQTIADYQDDVYESVEAMGATSLTEANKLTTKTARNEALDAATASIIEHLKDEFPNRLGEIKAAVRSVTKKIGESASSTKVFASTDIGHGHSSALGRIDLFPMTTARPCSSAARPRSST